MPFVLDNSVVSGWFLENQATPYTDAVAQRLRDDRAHVPAVWELEFTNVLRTACVRQRLDAQRAQAVVVQIGALPISVDRHPVARSEMLALASKIAALYGELHRLAEHHVHRGGSLTISATTLLHELAGGRLTTTRVADRSPRDTAWHISGAGSAPPATSRRSSPDS